MKRILSLLTLAVLIFAWATAGLGVTSRQTRLYGTAIFFNETMDNCKVTVTLAGQNYFYTSTQTVTAGQYITYTDTTGYFGLDVWGTDSLLPLNTATYTITIEHPELQMGGMKFEVNGLSIAADGDSTDIRDVLAQ